ncbi:hypothetical protein DV737_g1321, partial [Chaetothyriales sp. CBS 132003]
MAEEEYEDAAFRAAAPATKRPLTSGAAKVVQPKPQALPSRQGPSAILVSTRQKGNPILNHVKSLPWEFSDIPCDYVLGATTCALFLSLKYHRLHPEYIYSRLRQLGKLYNLRILLTMVDITNHEEALKELSKTSMINNLTLVLCWSAVEAGRYLELFKSYEHASPTSIRAHQAETYQESLREFVTTPRSINKTDAASLIANFGSLRAAVNAQPEEIAVVPGWGEKKVHQWCKSVREPFRIKRAAKDSIALRQQDTDAASADGLDVGRPGNAPKLSAIPISSVNMRNRSTMPSQSGDNSLLETEPKRTHRHTEEGSRGDGDDEEEAALLAASEQENRSRDASRPRTSPASRQTEPELSEGIVAALSKLRDQS